LEELAAFEETTEAVVGLEAIPRGRGATDNDEGSEANEMEPRDLGGADEQRFVSIPEARTEKNNATQFEETKG
jgi:hypothetical protein